MAGRFGDLPDPTPDPGEVGTWGLVEDVEHLVGSSFRLRGSEFRL